MRNQEPDGSIELRSHDDLMRNLRMLESLVMKTKPGSFYMYPPRVWSKDHTLRNDIDQT